MPSATGGLDADSLARRFGTVTAVEDVSLRVRPGEIVGLLGPNGAGKTTTLRMLAGILSPDHGRVLVDGLDMRVDPIAAKRRLGFLSGDTQLYQRLTSREMLAYFAQLYELEPGLAAERSRVLIEALDMQSFADRPCGTLSSGQKQRANVARAFLHEPRLLILDEPTNALDVVSGQFIVQAIRHKGFALVDVFQPCVTWNKLNTTQWFRDRVYRLDDTGHDPSDKVRAFDLSLTTYHEMTCTPQDCRIPIGVIYREEGRPTYQDGLPQLTGPLWQQAKTPRDISALIERA